MASSSRGITQFRYQSLKAAIEGSGMTQDEVAKLVGVHRTYINKLLREGKRQPSLDIALRISRVLDLDPAALV